MTVPAHKLPAVPQDAPLPAVVTQRLFRTEQCSKSWLHIVTRLLAKVSGAHPAIEAWVEELCSDRLFWTYWNA